MAPAGPSRKAADHLVEDQQGSLALQAARKPSRNPGAGARGMFAATGSTITQATAGRLARRQGTTSVSATHPR